VSRQRGHSGVDLRLADLATWPSACSNRWPHTRPVRTILVVITVHRDLPHRGLVAAAALTVVATVTFDLLAGEAPLHAVTLGAVAAAVALLRVRLGDRRRRLLQFVSGCIVAQPALHFSAKLIPHDPIEHGVGHAVGAADLFVIGTQITAALAIAAVISFAEQLIEVSARAAHRFYVLITVHVKAVGRTKLRPRFIPARQLLTCRYRPGSIPRRGPPVVA